MTRLEPALLWAPRFELGAELLKGRETMMNVYEELTVRLRLEELRGRQAAIVGDAAEANPHALRDGQVPERGAALDYYRAWAAGWELGAKERGGR